MKFIVYSQIDKKTLENNLGMPEYSYYFVYNGFLPVLKALGDVVKVSDPEQEVDTIYQDCCRRKESCIYISFSPPNKSAVNLHCPTVCVFAWEFDRIPDEMWDNDPKNDWRHVLSRHGGAITLSRYSADAVRKSMGQDFHVDAIPVPVWDFFSGYRSRYSTDHLPSDKTEISFQGNIVDNRKYDITPASFELIEPFDCFKVKIWSGETLCLGFSETDEYSAYLGGFYPPEPWGTWSRLEDPWVFFPYILSGAVHLKIRARGYVNNVNRQIAVSLGDEKKYIRLKHEFNEITVSFNLKKPENMLRFSGFDLTPVVGAADHRSMGIALSHVEISGRPLMDKPIMGSQDSSHKINLDGVVYTTVFNPIDDRKNWKEIIKAFGMAFQDIEDATLILKITHHSLASFLGELHYVLRQLCNVKCRIIALHGYLEPEDYEKLIAGTHFYVNASKCEGLCLPLMEYMACGKPSIAPYHTSLMDFISSETTLLVESSIEPSIWPHDSRQVFRTLKYRINWESLVDAFRKSYKIAKHQPGTYRSMAKAASFTMRAYSSNETVKSQLETFFQDHFNSKKIPCSRD